MIARTGRSLVLNSSRQVQRCACDPCPNNDDIAILRLLAFDVRRRTYANPPNPGADAAGSSVKQSGRSNALVVGSAIALFLGGLGAYNYSLTGRPQNLGKAIVRISLAQPLDMADLGSLYPGQVGKC